MKLSKWKVAALGLVAVLASGAVRADEVASSNNSDALESVNESMGSLTARISALESQAKSMVEVHGFAEVDMINDDTESFQETVGESGVKAQPTIAGNNGYTQFSPRNTRLDALGKGKFGSWNTKGYVEGDFLGYEGSAPAYGTATAAANTTGLNNEYKYYTQPTFRLRHAYVDMQDENTGLEILAGQWWSLYGWNMDYVLGTVSLAPVYATLYERTPQLRIQENLGDKTWGLQVAVDMEKPNEDQAISPNLGAGVRFLLPGWTGRFCPATGSSSAKPFSVGVSAMGARYAYQVSGTTASDSMTDGGSIWGLGLAGDIMVPVMPSDADGMSIMLVGEGTTGAGDAQGFNGGGFSGLSSLGAYTGTPSAGFPNDAILTNLDPDDIGIDANGNVALLAIDSYNCQLQFSMPKSEGSIITLGYGSIFSPNVQLLTGTPGFSLAKVYNNNQVLFANIMQDVTPQVRFALEYDEFMTNYVAGAGTNGLNSNAFYDHRIQLSSYYRF